jgi:hypothetical protein
MVVLVMMPVLVSPAVLFTISVFAGYLRSGWPSNQTPYAGERRKRRPG